MLLEVQKVELKIWRKYVAYHLEDLNLVLPSIEYDDRRRDPQLKNIHANTEPTVKSQQ